MISFRNPIFLREFSAASRSWKINFLVWSYLIILAAVMLLLWPGGGVHSAVSESSKQIFSLFFSANLTLLILLIPAFAATSITQEKENNTFAMLFSTLLSPLDIMLGKLAAALVMLIMVVALSIPISAVCALTGGVGFEVLLQVLILLFCTALSYGLVGLACSANLSRSSNSILTNYVFILILAGGTWLPDALLGNLVGFQRVWQFIRSFSPFDALYYVLYPENYRMTQAVTDSNPLNNPLFIYIAFSSIVSFVALVFFYRSILKPTGRGAKNQGEVYTDTKMAIKRKLTWPFYLFDPLKRKKNIRWGANPVYVAELRSKLFANPKFVLRTISMIFVISLCVLTLISLQYGNTLRADAVRMVAIIFQIGVVAMLAPGVSSGLITDEITSGTFMQLRLTPLKPITIIFGKLKATFFYALIFIVSSFFVLLAMAYLEHQQIFPECSITSPAFWVGGEASEETQMSSSRGMKARKSRRVNKTKIDKGVVQLAMKGEWWVKVWETYRRIIIWIIILLVSTVTFLTSGLFASAMAKSTGVATAIAYAITACICLVSMAPLVLAERLSSGFSSIILSFNPIAAAMQVTSDAFAEVPHLWQKNLFALSFLTAFFLICSTLKTWYLFNRQD